MGFELSLLQWVATAQEWGWFSVAASFFGIYLPYLIGLVVLLLLWQEEGRRAKTYAAGFLILLLIVSRGVVTELIRLFYHRPRPFSVVEISSLTDAAGWAFPSGHTVVACALACVVLLLPVRGWIRWGMVTSAGLVGVGRVMMGVHWPLDVVGGIAVVVFCFIVLRLLLPPSYARAIE